MFADCYDLLSHLMNVTDEISPICSSISWKCQIQHCYMICTLCLAFYECRLVAFSEFSSKNILPFKKVKHCQSPTQTHTHLSLLNTQGLEFEWVSVVSVCIILLIQCWYYVLLKNKLLNTQVSMKKSCFKVIGWSLI